MEPIVISRVWTLGSNVEVDTVEIDVFGIDCFLNLFHDYI